MPAITGIDQVQYLTSTTTMELEQLPKSMLVIGAGYIGVEIAWIFARAGVEITVFSRRGLLPEMEPEIGEALTRYFENEGIRVTTVNTYTRNETTESSVRLHVASNQGEQMLDAEMVLVATGRNPNTNSLNLSAAGIETHGNHGVKIDAHIQTSRTGVYAAGDVTARDTR